MFWRTTAVLGVFLASTALTSVTAQEVGVLAAVNRDMTGERPTEAPRQIFLQEKLVTNERIETSADGGGQVLFLDQTSLTITKNSLIVLDKYVYDPDADTGELGVSVLKGAMRMVGGRITKKKPALIRTPSATIGIRGGIGTVTVRDDGSTIYMHVAGISSTIQGDTDDTLTITREGGVAVVRETGEVEYVGVADEETVQAIYSPVATGEGDGQSEEEGSASGQTTEQRDQERTQRRADTEEGVELVAEENSGDEDAPEEAPISTQGERQEREETTAETDVEEDAEEEQADNAVEEVAEEIIDDIDQNIDQLLFTGSYDATLTGGAAAGVANNLNFEMVYSINNAEGFVSIELPSAAVSAGIGSETLDGQAIIADSFVVGGTDLQALTAEAGLGTLLGGDAANTTLAIAPDVTVSGNIDIDYTTSSFVEVDNLIGELGPVSGEAVDDISGAAVSDIVNDLRQVISGN